MAIESETNAQVWLTPESIQHGVEQFPDWLRVRRDEVLGGQDAPLTIVPIMLGGLFFAVDLMRALERHPLNAWSPKIAPMRISSYGDGRKASRPTFLLDADPEQIRGHVVVLVDDICDTGATIDAARRRLLAYEPLLLLVAVVALVAPPSAAELHLLSQVDYYIKQKKGGDWLVGYGLDLQQTLRGADRVWSLPAPS